MKKQVEVSVNNRQKDIIINFLFAITIIIMLLGFGFSVYSVVNNVSFQIINSSIHGAVFGMMVIYLGFRYFLSVKKLRGELYKASSKFSWANFKKEKKKKYC
ncbi:MAG: hypothetical protein PHX08_24730 [Lachnospiraceae bacterium]|nr:hypothetical protein [Lachnospiraceae bacterium]